MGRIVVGVDGSQDSRAALRWAVQEAVAKGDHVRAVYVYGPNEEHNPFLGAHSSFAGPSSTPADAQRWQQETEGAGHRQAVDMLRAIVRDATEGVEGSRVEEVAESGGRPARVLLRHADGADLLVVGARGRGGFRDLRLGSISEKLVRHAPCSVMVRRSA